MSTAHDKALHRLCGLVGELGTDGGTLTPAVYDTARIATLLPSRRHTDGILDWLASRQRADGGWGAPRIPHARDLPTLAAILALHRSPAHRAAARYGADFLRRHAPRHWGGPPGQDIPVGLELLLPPLLDEARAARLPLPDAPYEALRALNEHRRHLLRRRAPHAPGTAPVHSWEGWGTTIHSLPVDGSGSIGHSPAATATALAQAADHPLADRLEDYLARAAGSARPPLLPTVWPIDNFERVWGLHALALAGLLHHRLLADVCARHLDLLQRSLTPEGMGMSDHFTADGDITATATAVLALAGRPAGIAAVDRFRHRDHYRTYPHELQTSLTTTAHALHTHALHTAPGHLRSGRPESVLQFIRERQHRDGRWSGDKWHTSWIYTTAQIITALPAGPAVQHGVQALLRAQRTDGGWGAGGQATAGETGYAVLALHTAARHEPLTTTALHRAADWLSHWQETRQPCDCRLWTGKEPYCPTRVDQTVALAALATPPARAT
ncbi:prenyltransferase/squalene oxidase repeat-containing protein [Streptomyces varsoviensis]|uniref:prenyltransferase/squalene oxidase repeat-containing protein n=1 Tax=Streptomyces varsoviensis TaxID=67373 RepID=UPI0004CC77B5|nr:prenyltransferase/squalene oxidase repeat-containing protein [Streptomyces varsoviensis]